MEQKGHVRFVMHEMVFRVNHLSHIIYIFLFIYEQHNLHFT